ncbi:hypothetical protein I6A60_20235 [Frankia sp. AgB1.9]|uniref:DUF6300 family protein n=1 Tax=unclassified Frankia TaxID=2632575 RepID=UPI0019341308|nr:MULTISPECIES: DUF6300 family protein [unclassified Frankia]MBL7491903.1 hypothetical protein [Frankia sp. AgW1.1]MBL7550192.1 hypothetical protein [Frankia sp. AgB1.9]MBL7619851.1 hypothetical protein [Frankia sp. AgB1.8]
MTDGCQVEIETADEVPSCLRCGGEGLAAARVPHAIQAANGPVEGFHRFVLCPSCDADDPAAAGLITYFHVHGQVSTETQGQFVDLLSRWASALTVATVNPTAWEDDLQAWLQGDL